MFVFAQMVVCKQTCNYDFKSEQSGIPINRVISRPVPL